MFAWYAFSSSAERFSRIAVAIAGCIFVLVTSANSACCQSFRLSKVSLCYNSFSSPCSEVNPPYENLDRSKFLAGRIYVRLFIIAEQDAFNFLKENGNLPVYVSIWRDGTKQKGDLSVGISQDDWDANGAALSDVFSEQGNFTWRTHFNVGISKSIEIAVTDYRKNIIYVGRDPARVMISFAN